MNPGWIIALIGLEFTVLSMLVGVVVWAVRKEGIVNQHERTLDRHQEWIKETAKKAEQIPALIKSIEHLGDAMSANVKHLIDRMDQSNTHIHEQLTDIKEQIKPRRRSTGD